MMLPMHRWAHMAYDHNAWEQEARDYHFAWHAASGWGSTAEYWVELSTTEYAWGSR